MSRPRDRQAGVAAVEFALVMPLLLILAMGVIDVGRALYTLVAIQEAAQEGAVFGAFQPGDSDLVRQRVIESVDSPELTTADVTVECPGGPTGRVIGVTAEHDLSLITPIVGQWFGGEIHLTRTVKGDVYSNDPCEASP